MYSPSDCLFWLHHANVDRIWYQWQKKNPNKNPILNGVDAIMDPWSFNEVETRDIANFGYEYI
jgi:tyrosinase